MTRRKREIRIKRPYLGRRLRRARLARRAGLERLEDRRMLAVDLLAMSELLPSDVGAVFSRETEIALLQLPKQAHLFDLGDYLSQPSDSDPLGIALSFLDSRRDAFGLGTTDLASAIVTDQFVSSRTGTTHIYLRQTLGGLEVANANINVNVSADGQIISAGGGFVRNLLDALTTALAMPELSATEALEAAAGRVGYALELPATVIAQETELSRQTLIAAPDISLDAIPARLFYVPTSTGGVTLAWNLVVHTIDQDHWYDLGVDASTGEIVFASDWVDDATYNVFAPPVESPDHGGRTLLTDPHDVTASPFGWHDTDGVAGAEFTDTRGNNVFAQEDRAGNNTRFNASTLGDRPDGGPSLDFDFPVDFGLDPIDNQDAAITNLFYWNNLLHDIHYQYGFDEAAGNFQLTNYTGLGLGNDPVRADTQDGSGTNNANFSTPPDGTAPLMQMFDFTLTTPNRDSAFDNAVVIHEYGHGVSNRLTGGPANANGLGALQSRGMGEGWSDWWALMLTQESTDTMLDAYPIATYVLGESPTGDGIRRFPYSFDMGINSLTYDDYNVSNEVHDSGEIWAAALWDMNWLLVEKYGFDADLYQGTAGNNRALQLVMDALKLQPANPSFLDARDAILLAAKF